jgi:hypothetical protein
MKTIYANHECKHIPGWILPSAYLFLLPFGRLFILPLILMAIIGVIYVCKYGLKNLFKQHDCYRYLFLIFGLIWLPMLFSLPDAFNFNHSFTTTLGIFPLFFAGIYIISEIDNQKTQKSLFNMICFIILIWCIDALLQLFTGKNVFGYSKYLPTHLSGVFSPKATLGLVLAVLSPVIFERLRVLSGGIYSILFACGLAAIYISLIVLSGSRTGLIMLIVGLFGWISYISYINKYFTWPKIILIFVAILSIIGLLAYQQPTRYGTSLQSVISGDLKTIDKFSGGRVGLWETSGRIYINHWFNGIGPRGYRYAYDEYRPVEGKYHWDYPDGSTHPHFVLLEIATETGVIGIIGILLAIYFIFKPLSGLSIRQKTNAFPWMLGALLAIVPNIGKAFYSSFWLSLIMWMIFIGIANTRSDEL